MMEVITYQSLFFSVTDVTQKELYHIFDGIKTLKRSIKDRNLLKT